jgi:hypothetical protein
MTGKRKTDFSVVVKTSRLLFRKFRGADRRGDCFWNKDGLSSHGGENPRFKGLPAVFLEGLIPSPVVVSLSNVEA